MFKMQDSITEMLLKLSLYTPWRKRGE